MVKLRAKLRRKASAISWPYGHEAARGVLRGCRAPELLAGRRPARGDAARGEPADPVARAAHRAAASRPLRAPGRADGGRPSALPRSPTADRARAAAARGAWRGGGGRAEG